MKSASEKETVSSCQITPYLDEDHIREIKAYKYVGSDTGIFYIYFYSPLANFMVEHVIPPFVA